MTKRVLKKTKSMIQGAIAAAVVLGSLLGVAGEHSAQPYAF